MLAIPAWRHVAIWVASAFAVSAVVFAVAHWVLHWHVDELLGVLLA
jgi:hypothetical protein